MDRRREWSGGGERGGRRGGGLGPLVVPWALAVALVGSLLGAVGAAGATGAANEEHVEGGTIELRRAVAPTPEERQRMLLWHRIWREETGPLRKALGRLGAEDYPAPVADRQWCGVLGSAVLAVDRERVFPAPSYGVGARLHRGLGALVRAATACFEGRTHEAAFRLSQAHEAFARAARLLRPYGVEP